MGEGRQKRSRGETGRGAGKSQEEELRACRRQYASISATVFLHALHEHAGWIAQSLPVVGSGGVCPSRFPQSERDGRSVHCEGGGKGAGGEVVVEGEVEVEGVVVGEMAAAAASG